MGTEKKEEEEQKDVGRRRVRKGLTNLGNSKYRI